MVGPADMSVDGQEHVPRPAAPRPPATWPSWWWSVRHLRDLDNSIALWPEEAYRADVIVRQFKNRTTIVANHPEAVKRVLVTNVANYRRDRQSRTVLRHFVGDGILTAEGEFWQKQRRTAVPAFRPDRLDRLVPQIAEATTAALAHWSDPATDTPIDVAREMRRLTLCVLSQTMFSRDLAARAETVEATISDWMDTLGSRMYASGVGARVLGLPWSWASGIANRFTRLPACPFDAIVSEFLAARERHGGEADDLLARLTSAVPSSGDDDVAMNGLRGQVGTYLFAGHETTAIALAWSFYLVALHRWAAERLQAEVDEVLADRQPEANDLPRLAYTRMVLAEAMRLYPPVFSLFRETLNDDELAGQAVPSGARILILPWLIHRHRRLWERPDYFDPERFTGERITGRDRFAYLPFANGPRMCLGSTFAEIEATIILAMVVQRYNLRLAPGHRVEPVGRITLRPRDGIRVIVKRR